MSSKTLFDERMKEYIVQWSCTRSADRSETVLCLATFVRKSTLPALKMHLPTFPKIYNTYFVAFVATVGGMLFGFDISSMSAIILTDQYNDYFNNPAGALQGAIGSALAAGSVLGSLIAGPISNKIGRRDSIMFACFWWLAGTAVQTATINVGSLIAGRVLNGVTVGITSSQVPVYLAEIARKEKRGSLVIIQQLAIGGLHPESSRDVRY